MTCEGEFKAVSYRVWGWLPGSGAERASAGGGPPRGRPGALGERVAGPGAGPLASAPEPLRVLFFGESPLVLWADL